MGRRLEVFLADGEVQDVKLDGESLWPTWFKVEWKETGQRSAKIRGERLSTNFGDEIIIVQAGPATRPTRRRAATTASGSRARGRAATTTKARSTAPAADGSPEQDAAAPTPSL